MVELDIYGIIQYAFFWIWLLWFTVLFVIFTHVVYSYNSFLVLYSIKLYDHITLYSFSYWCVFGLFPVWDLQIMPLWTFFYSPFRANMYILLLSVNVEVKLLGLKQCSAFRIHRRDFWRIVPVYTPTKRPRFLVLHVLAALANVSDFIWPIVVAVWQYLFVLSFWFLWWMISSPFSCVYWPFIYSLVAF